MKPTPTRKSLRNIGKQKILPNQSPAKVENEETLMEDETVEEGAMNDVQPKRRRRRSRGQKPVGAARTRTRSKMNNTSRDSEVQTSTDRKKKPNNPNIANLSVSLGLEKAPKRLTRAQQRRLNEEELQEERYNEDLRIVDSLEELIQQTKLEGSDDESASGDVGYMEISDDEDLNGIAELNESLCPRPLPKRTRGGNKSLKRGGENCNEEVPQEVDEVCRLIKSSISGGKSLTATTSTLTEIKQDPDNLESVVGSIKTEPETHFYHVHGALRQVLGVQNQWLNETAKTQVVLPNKSIREVCAHHAQKNGLATQMNYEHLSWLATASFSSCNEKPNILNNGLLAWLPSFQKKFVSRYPQLVQNGTPDSGTDLDLLLKLICVKNINCITKILKTLISARAAFMELIKHVSKVYHDKCALSADFEFIHGSLNVARYEESIGRGRKPIKLALTPPYFKTEDGLMAYPMTPDALSRITNFGCCFFKRDKQKWTTKDFQQLKMCIKETLQSKRLSALGDRYEVLMADCIRKYDEDMAMEGRFNAPPLGQSRRRCGPKWETELDDASKFGIIHPVIAVLPNGITIRTELSPRHLAEWRAKEERSLKVKTYEELVLLEGERIDWTSVSNKMVVKSRKHRTAEDCELAWRHEVHPRVNDKRWSVEKSRRLKEIYSRVGNDWFAVAQELNAPTDIVQKPGRTPYQCYFRIRNRLDPPKKLCWTPDLDNHVFEKIKEYPGAWRLVAASIDDPAATKRQVIERCKKIINPVLRNGAFTRVEDCLLLLTIEKLKPFLALEGHFGCLLSYLPWRFETTWRDRANNLFSDWIVPWTLEEDKMLLQLAKTMNRNWQKISEEFTSFKNRKGCLTRYKILMRHLKDERFNNSLEAYHEAYAMTRYNVFQYKHLKEILDLLTRVQQNPLPKQHRKFVGLLRDQDPSEVRLQHMLLTFDKVILDSTIKSLTRYIETRDNYWKNWISKHGERKRTFDRRTFHPENPQSVASALHIRGLELKPKDKIPNLSDFEDEIYKYYARFRRTKALKPDADRPYIPDAKTLAQWSEVCRLIETQVDELDDVPLKRKWKALTADVVAGNSASERTRKKTVRKMSEKPKAIRRTSINNERSGAKKDKGKRTPALKPTNCSSNDNDSNEGRPRILAPPKPVLPRTMRRGRSSRRNQDADSEFLITPKKGRTNNRNVGIEVNDASCRRSLRNAGAPKNDL